MKTENYTLENYIADIKEGDTLPLEDGMLLDLVIDAVNAKPNDRGEPTDRQILETINHALYLHFNVYTKTHYEY